MDKRQVFRHELEQRFAGVHDPREMGTTGLAAWVLAGPGGDRQGWNRTRTAVALIRRRGGHVPGFIRAVLLDVHNRWQLERYRGYFLTLANMASHTTNRKETI